jgi:hypothetical protein
MGVQAINTGKVWDFVHERGEKLEPVHVPIAYIYIYIDTYIGSKCALKL